MSKLVVIDDDPIDHFLMQHILHGNQHFDMTTYTMYGSLVLDYIEENKAHPDKLPDTIFLDLNMPMFSGWDFLDRYQQLFSEIDKNIKIYILTSSIRPADMERTSRYPFVRSFISKPLKQNTLREINEEEFC
ncbi:MAG TPA: response regulator [Mucilaginibacter sp.]|nr:response regulator [Mucilaginibacter sp.]